MPYESDRHRIRWSPIADQTIASNTRFTISGGLPGPIDTRASVDPVVRAELLLSANAFAASGINAILLSSDGQVGPISPGTASALQDHIGVMSNRSLVLGRNLRSRDALEVVLELRGQREQPTVSPT